MSALRPVPFFDDPLSALLWVQEELEAAVTTPKHPWNMGVISYTPVQSHPSLKTIVWRECHAASSRLGFYTDVRSAKWSALHADPHIQGLFWCPQRWVQLSIRGRAKLHHGTPECRHTFQNLTTDQQSAYISAEPPGAPFSEASSRPIKTLDPTLGDAYFGQVDFDVEAFDLVSLHQRGHQRVRGRALNQPDSAIWLCP